MAIDIKLGLPVLTALVALWGKNYSLCTLLGQSDKKYYLLIICYKYNYGGEIRVNNMLI